jgi:hypothetical protein
MPRVGMRIAVWRVGMAAAGIGAAFGIERSLDLNHARAEPLHHRLDDVIAPDPQAPGRDLGRQMAVAEMPGDADQMLRINPANLDQRLGRGHHLDKAAVVEHQRVAAAQRDGVFEIEQEFKPTRAGHRHPPPVPVVEIEHDGIGWRLRPLVLAKDLRRPDHAKTLTIFPPCRR